MRLRLGRKQVVVRPTKEAAVPAAVLHGAAVGGAAGAGVGTGEVRDASPTKPKRKGLGKSYWVGWAAAMVMIGAVAGGLIVLVVRFTDGPVDGTVSAKSLSALQASSSPKPQTPNHLSGLLIEMDYPAVFDSLSQVKNDAQSLEQYNIGSKTSYQRVIAVSVRNLPTGKLDDDSSFRFRTMQREEYTIAADTIGTEPVMIATKGDRMEQTLFWAHAGKEVSVSVTTSNPNKDDVKAYMQSIKASLRWRK